MFVLQIDLMWTSDTVATDIAHTVIMKLPITLHNNGAMGPFVSRPLIARRRIALGSGP